MSMQEEERKPRRSRVVHLRPQDKDTQSAALHAGSDDRADLSRLLRSLWRRKWFVAFWTLACAGLFGTMTSFQPSKFTAAATVMLDAREQKVVSPQNEVVADLQLNTPIVESEVAVLRSAGLLEAAVLQIGIEAFEQIDPANAPPSLLNRTIGALRGLVSSGENAPAVPDLLPPERRKLNRIMAALRQGMSVRRLGDSYVIDIRFETIDPALSAQLANTLAQTYITAQLEDRQRFAENATRWLADQVAARRADLTRSEAEVEGFKRSQLDQAGTSQVVLEQQLREATQQLSLASSDRATQEARLAQIEALLAERGPAAAAESQSSAYLSGLRNGREALLRDDARLAGQLGTEHPDRQKIASELVQINAAIATEMRNIVQGYRNEILVLRTREAALQAQVDTIERRLSDFATSSLRLRQLEREAEAARDAYETLVARLGETRAQVEIQRAEAKLLNAALIPGGPSGPRVKLMTGFGAMLGLTLALIAALALELMTTGFLLSSDLARATGLRVLTVIPRVRMKRPRAVLWALESAAYSLLAERVRQLRAILDRSAPVGQGQSILLLSSVPEEGKTSTAIALAHSYAQAGHKTLLLDFDTRRSVLSKEFPLPAQRDLLDVIAGTARIDEAILRPEEMEVDLLGTQRKQMLMTGEYSRERIAKLLRELEGRYQVVIIDAPPVLAVSDGLSLAQMAHSVIYLVRYRKTSRKSVSYGFDALKNIGVRPTGLVITMADVDADPDGYAQGYVY